MPLIESIRTQYFAYQQETRRRRWIILGAAAYAAILLYLGYACIKGWPGAVR